jgi:hypothetical protein
VRALSRGFEAESAREGLVDDLKDDVPHHLLDIQRQLSAGPWHPTIAAGPDLKAATSVSPLVHWQRPNVPKSANAFLTPLGFGRPSL